MRGIPRRCAICGAAWQDPRSALTATSGPGTRPEFARTPPTPGLSVTVGVDRWQIPRKVTTRELLVNRRRLRYHSNIRSPACLGRPGEGVWIWHRYQRSLPAAPHEAAFAGSVRRLAWRRYRQCLGLARVRPASRVRSKSNGAGMPERSCRAWPERIEVVRSARYRRRFSRVWAHSVCGCRRYRPAGSPRTSPPVGRSGFPDRVAGEW